MEAQEAAPQAPATPPTAATTLAEPLLLFGFKAMMATAAVVITVWMTAGIIAGEIEDTVNRLLDRQLAHVTSKIRLRGDQIWPRLERTLDNAVAANYDLSPEKQKKILADVRIVSERWRPFFTELAVAMAGGTPDGSSQPGK